MRGRAPKPLRPPNFALVLDLFIGNPNRIGRVRLPDGLLDLRPKPGIVLRRRVGPALPLGRIRATGRVGLGGFRRPVRRIDFHLMGTHPVKHSDRFARITERPVRSAMGLRKNNLLTRARLCGDEKRAT